jgi:hypothetical protein
MPRRFLAVMVAALVLALVAPAMAGSREDARDRTEAMAAPGRALIIDNGETKENLEQIVVNHLGNPNQGQVLIQTWVEPDWSNAEAVDIQAAAQAVKIRRAGAGFAKRIAIRVELWAEGEPNQFSSTVNTGDVNGTTFVQTPETGGLNTDPDAFCLWFSNASYAIRWDDNTLTSGRFLTAQGDWLNPVCMVAPASDLRLR